MEDVAGPVKGLRLTQRLAVGDPDSAGRTIQVRQVLRAGADLLRKQPTWMSLRIELRGPPGIHPAKGKAADLETSLAVFEGLQRILDVVSASKRTVRH